LTWIKKEVRTGLRAIGGRAAMALMNATNEPALSEDVIRIVKSTAPVLQEHGETLTRHFYERMFRENPEVAPLFNSRNQQGGTQQRALAAAICAFAANLDRLEVLGAAVEGIAQKHAGLGILPEHYPIVGANLLASIREVLEIPETHEIIGAWAEAYGFLAHILMGRERSIYQEQESAPHGWSGFRNFVLGGKRIESEVISSFFLKPADGGKVPSYKPGQYLTVRVPDGNGATSMRNYSLSGAPQTDFFRISVKAERDGVVSGYLHQLEEGSEIQIGPPCGEFFLDPEVHSEKSLVLISAGVGITPVMAMLEATVVSQPQRQVVFIHGARNGRVHAFRDAVESLSADHGNLAVHFRYSDPLPEDSGHDSAGLIDAELIESLIPGKDCEFYFCGPKEFMAGIYRQLLEWGVPGSRVHFEFFGPKEALEA
jgi:nitric oxide dioxygenase